VIKNKFLNEYNCQQGNRRYHSLPPPALPSPLSRPIGLIVCAQNFSGLLYALAWHTEWSFLQHDVTGNWKIPFAANTAATLLYFLRFPPKLTLLLGGLGPPPPSNTRYLWPTQVVIPNDRFSRFCMGPKCYAVQCIVSGEENPQNCPFPLGFRHPARGDRARAIGIMHRKIGKDRACGSRDILVDRQTHRQTCSSQYFATTSTGKVTINFLSVCVTHFTSTWLCSNMQLACSKEYSQNSNTCTFTSLNSCEMSAYDYCTLGTAAGPQ